MRKIDDHAEHDLGVILRSPVERFDKIEGHRLFGRIGADIGEDNRLASIAHFQRVIAGDVIYQPPGNSDACAPRAIIARIHIDAPPAQAVDNWTAIGGQPHVPCRTSRATRAHRRLLALGGNLAHRRFAYLRPDPAPETGDRAVRGALFGQEPAANTCVFNCLCGSRARLPAQAECGRRLVPATRNEFTRALNAQPNVASPLVHNGELSS